MKEITEEQIREAAERISEPFGSRYKACIKMAKWMQEQMQPEWIKTDDQDPPTGMLLVHYQTGEIMIVHNDDVTRQSFTHWMPLPNPPKA